MDDPKTWGGDLCFMEDYRAGIDSHPQRYRPNYDTVCGEDELAEPLGGVGRLSDSLECFTS